MIGLLALLAAAVQPDAGAAVRAPEAIWRSACGYCHQGSKVGPPIPRGIDAAAVRMVVRNGLNAMPPFHPAEISDGELDALAAWLKAGRQERVAPR